jgi:hypothetical protein
MEAEGCSQLLVIFTKLHTTKVIAVVFSLHFVAFDVMTH